MIITETNLSGLYVIKSEPFGDDRGYFERRFCSKEFKEYGLQFEMVQVNKNFNVSSGTLRGLHFQNQPFSETKVVQCSSGSIQDVVVDIRTNSPTYLEHFSIVLTEQNGISLYIPKGFAHGYLSLEDNSAALYMVDQGYEPNSEGGVRFDDPKLQINWMHSIEEISEKDQSWPYLVDS